jgi:hypothetical protein
VVNLSKFTPEALYREEQRKQQQKQFREMLDQLDKKEIGAIFNYGLKLGLFAKTGRIHFSYEHNGFTYIITRYKSGVQIMGEMIS